MFKFFKTKILIHIASILVLLVLGVLAYESQQSVVLLVFLGSVLIGVVLSLFRLVDKTNEEVANFLLNIKYDDYAATYTVSRAEDESFQKLHGAFNIVTEKFRDIRSQKEAQFQYLQAIVENVDTGLICFEENGRSVLMNRALQRLLHKSYFPTFESIGQYDAELLEALRDIQPGERRLVKIVVKGQILQLAIRTTLLKMLDTNLQLFAIHNIHAELEEQEVASWQKLIRILTHEIMNSVAPVVSLAATTNDMLSSTDEVSSETSDDIRSAIEAIHKRSEGLLHFTETYRQLTKIPPPNFQPTDPAELLDRVLVLFKPTFARDKIALQKKYPVHPLTIQADQDLLEQVCINLIKNAIEAVAGNDNPEISIEVFKDDEGAAVLQVSDNGAGIPEALQEQIFIPFFTTKNEGSGIGLSLCRQIIHMHKGNLSVFSKEGKGATFVIKI